MVRYFFCPFLWFWGAAAARRLIQHEENGVEGRYIVLLKKNEISNDSVTSRIDELYDTVRQRSYDTVQLAHKFDGTLVPGFTIENADEQAIETLLENDDVLLIEQDQVVRADFFKQFVDDILAGRNPFLGLLGLNDPPQNAGDAVSWGLDRINQRTLPLDGNTDFGPYTGSGVDVYILDSGLRTSHSEFQGRAFCSLNVIDRDSSVCSDGTGHGTHVAAVVGGRTYGVAPGAQLHSVKVLDNRGEGYSSWVIEGLEHVVTRALQTTRPVVVNLSLGALDSDALNSAVDAAAAVGVVFVVSAGNEGINACRKAPAGSERAITVASLEENDTPSSFSNYGSCVNIFAPGSRIVSASGRGDSSNAIMTGTSQAAPHVAGVAALYLERDPAMQPSDVWRAMVDDASNSVITMGLSMHQLSGSPNRVVRTP